MNKWLEGLELSKTRLIITVDGLDNKTRSRYDHADERLARYVQNIRTGFPWATVLPARSRMNLVANLQAALRWVETEFVYIIQHDMPFQRPVNHTCLILTIKRHPPPIIDLVRFHYIRRHADTFNNCNTTEIHFYDDATGIELTKHHVWSDNNHITRKSYYDHLWKCCASSNYFFMEHNMRERAWSNCTHWGTHLYGPQNYFDVLKHLDGRFNLGNGTFLDQTKQWRNCRTDQDDMKSNCGR